jgi:arylsulfatase
MKILSVVTLALACSLDPVAGATARPNMIIIMSDDMGWSDLGCYGGEIKTPNLDALARDGLRFTQFYNTGRCCPTRASLLTGLYPHQAGIGHMMEDCGFDGYRGDLNRNCLTIGEALKPAGYATYAVGKWHVTPKTGAKDDREKHNWPLQRGFDRFYGTIHGAGSFFDPNSLVRDNALISPFSDPEYHPRLFYYTDAINDHAVRFIREHDSRAGNRPFFLYVAHTAAHWPMHAKDEDVAKYEGKFNAGYDAIRRSRLEKQKKLGLIDPRWAPAPTVGDWATVTNKGFETRCMEVYAAMGDCMDQGIGRIAAELKRLGQLDNTLIFFLQDNGGCAEGMGRGGNFVARAAGPTLPPMNPTDLQLDMVPKQTRDGYPVRQGYGVLPGGPDTYHGYGRDWANVSNTPFREYKHWVHEGGISTPLIVHWPNGIAPSHRNRFCHQPAHLIDLMATCVDLAGAKYPAERDGRALKPLEGISLAPAFAGKLFNRVNPIFWEHEGNRAIREGRWKLVAKENRPWELYDMEADRTETRDLAAQMPEKVKELEAKWDAYAARADVLPLGAWRGQKPAGSGAGASPKKARKTP